MTNEIHSRTYVLNGTTREAPRAERGLYLVATPIGHLGDITLRALDLIAGADVLACEDTRVTGKLLSRFQIKRRMTPYHDHSSDETAASLVETVQAGRSVAIVSDAGTPLVSDPGYRLVRAAIEADVPIFAIPGASAILTALAVSGLPSDAFFFAGFLPSKEKARLDRIAALTRVPGTLVIYEAPHRIAQSLAAMAEGLGDREAAVCRELTKMHETVYRGTLTRLAQDFCAMDQVKGEIVVCIAPPPQEAAPAEQDVDAILAGLLAEMKPTQAAREAARLTGLNRRDLYQRALALKDGQA
ncbi:16S rRNA (cytidine(1402)-2'-O)-methyltransferase [Fulvimarina sp. 2208YS6-2-32]|uniref:Ribosomal RNA small subunit methyltransferase I n=1 Tax=Fulvimarina uroteuthidis TaxID=3098149 RepID=A0ABU5I4D6_9HYPH|nr:16S rRNA (cytidine(1402)-2'-O)-methyltransferase [Fulvimarina sp. 2208YS6-2-32]MDY8110250.1 16S rRNA (cytidine(1402)-2'-O)-methyltransferase [Fulvimarina sp. 2208YS6-2-32]